MLISDFRIFVRECNQAYNSMKTMCLPFMLYYVHVHDMNIIPSMQTMTTNNRTQNTNGINYN